ncbi:MAG: hypothetical protein EPN47_10030 [Acidobacteria bacterium]|nr:MAG: hypothetical protein EPN47_10030 [Acidobacteriota bacterium]
MFLAIEAGLVVVALAIAFTVPSLGSRWFAALERTFGNLARQRGLSIITVGLSSMSLRAALLPILPVPVPGVSDEFGYLLLSDTFAHGRLTNPTSPMWMHFENSAILWHPTYTSKYWPAQGMFMALGQALMGHPFWGVWLSIGLMCAAITWMLQAWVGERWALLGGFLALIRFGTFNYWANSYWGGAVTAFGGALVLGALPRLKRGHRVRNALLMGAGFAILATSRPFEGLFFCIPVAVALLVWLWKLKPPELGRALKGAMVPLVAVLALTLVGMGYYFRRTTGSPFKTPYVIFEHTYNPIPIFPWQPLKPFPAYNYPHIRRVYLEILDGFYQPTQTFAGLVAVTLTRLGIMGSFYFGAVFIFPLLFAAGILPVGFSWRKLSANTRLLAAVSAAVILANLLPIWYMPHYTSPATCALLALVLIAIRRVQSFEWRGKSSGLFIARAIPSICILLLVLRVAAPAWADNRIPDWCYLTASNDNRADVLHKLKGYAGAQLAIVHHNPESDYGFDDWVYNRADLDSAKVIWAHDMGPAKNQELINYFKGRNVWLVDADSHPPKLEPYPEEAGDVPSAQKQFGPPSR